MSDPRVNIIIDAENKTGGVFRSIIGGLGDIARTAAGFVIGDLLGDALRSAARAIPEMISGASNLSETMNRVGIVFGDAGQTIIDFTQNAATQFGQSQQAMLDAAATFGVFGQSAGLTGEELAVFSTDLAGLASDIASFNNATPEEVVVALGAALRGEAEPMRRFGVLLDDATLRAKALELGIISTTNDALTPQQRVLAANAVIWEQTANAQGDFARTSEGLANQQRILTAQMNNMKTVLGAALLPVISQFTGMINEFVSSEGFNDFIARASEGLGNFAEWLGAALPVAIQTVSDLWTGTLQPAIAVVWDFLANVFIPFLQNSVYPWLAEYIPVAIGILAAFWTGTLQPAIAEVWSWLSSTLVPFLQNELFPWLAVNIPIAIQALSAFWTGVLQPAIAAVWSFVRGTVFPIIRTLFDWLATVIPPIIQHLADYWQNLLLPAIRLVWDFIKTNVMPLLVELARFIGTVLGVAITALAGLWQNVLQPALNEVWDFLSANFKPILDAVAGALGGIGRAIGVVIGWLRDMRTALADIELPDWLTPGSPTPFETGLRGIAAAMHDLNGLTTSVNMTPRQLAMARAGATSNYTMNIHTNARESTLVRDFGMMKAMAG